MRRFVKRIPDARSASPAVSQSPLLGSSCSPRAGHITRPAGTSGAMPHGRTRVDRRASRSPTRGASRLSPRESFSHRSASPQARRRVYLVHATLMSSSGMRRVLVPTAVFAVLVFVGYALLSDASLGTRW